MCFRAVNSQNHYHVKNVFLCKPCLLHIDGYLKLQREKKNNYITDLQNHEVSVAVATICSTHESRVLRFCVIALTLYASPGKLNQLCCLQFKFSRSQLVLETDMLPRLRTRDHQPRHMSDYPHLRYPLVPFRSAHIVLYLLDNTSQRLFFANLSSPVASRNGGNFILRKNMLTYLLTEPLRRFFEKCEAAMNLKLSRVSGRGKFRNVRLYLATGSKRSLCFQTRNLTKRRHKNLEPHRLPTACPCSL